MNLKAALSGVLLPSGWSRMLLSIAFYLFFWSVDNNPGAKDVPALLKAAIAFSSMGGLAFLSGNFHLIKEKAWIMLVVERVACIASLVCAISLSPILLLFMRKKRFFGC